MKQLSTLARTLCLAAALACSSESAPALSVLQGSKRGLPREASRPSQCLICHSVESPELIKLYKGGIHAASGVTCVSCHGGNPAASDIDGGHSKSAGFLRKLEGRRSIQVCASCHGEPQKAGVRQLDPKIYTHWSQSKHGALFEKGDARGPSCLTCHGTHGILGHLDPEAPTYHKSVPKLCASCHSHKEKMGGSKLGFTEFSDYIGSVHGTTLLSEDAAESALAPSCADCHDRHSSRRPGVKEVPNVCGDCHSEEKTYLKRGPHYAALKATGKPNCVTCHHNHKVTPTAGGSRIAVCVSCHKEKDDPTRKTAEHIVELLKAADVEIERMTAAVDAAETSASESQVRLFEVEAKHARAVFKRFRRQAHMLDSAALEHGLARLRRDVDTTIAIAEADLSQDSGFSTTAVTLILAAIALFLLGISALLVLILRRLARRMNGNRAMQRDSSASEEVQR